MKVSRRWIQWAHGPGADDGQALACKLCALAEEPDYSKRGLAALNCRVEISDPVLIAELVDVAELYLPAARDDVLREMGPWWLGEGARILREGRAILKQAA